MGRHILCIKSLCEPGLFLVCFTYNLGVVPTNDAIDCYPSDKESEAEVTPTTAPPPRAKGQYVPSFIPPSMAAAMEADEQAKRAQVEDMEMEEVSHAMG